MEENKAVYTATEVAYGLAGALMKMAYPSIWAGVLIQNPPKKAFFLGLRRLSKKDSSWSCKEWSRKKSIGRPVSFIRIPEKK